MVSVGSGGATFPPQLVRDLHERFPKVRLGSGYGMSESTGLGTITGGDLFISVPDSAGPAQPTVEVQIRDEFGTVLRAGETGQIHLRTPSIFLGYWEDPSATAAALDQERWYATGDYGLISNGMLYLQSRRRDLILRGGENIYPVEIENRLLEHAQIDDAAVIGVDHPELGQELKAFIVRSPGAGSARPRCATGARSRWPGTRSRPTSSSWPPSPTTRPASCSSRNSNARSDERRLEPSRPPVAAGRRAKRGQAGQACARLAGVSRIAYISGRPGAGKSSLAFPLAAELGYSLVTKDMVKEALHDALFVPGEGKIDLAWSRWLGGASFALLWTLAAHAGDMVIEANFDPHNDEALGQLRGLGGRDGRGALRVPGRSRPRPVQRTAEARGPPGGAAAVRDGINTTGRSASAR